MHSPSSNGSIPVSLADVLPLLIDALKNDRAWLQDFAEDVVHVPRDLYEVIVAYHNMLQTEAA